MARCQSPCSKAPLIDLAISWQSLWDDHAVVAKVRFINPEVNFVDGGANRQASQTGKGTDWRAQLGKLAPFTLDEVRIEDGARSPSTTSAPSLVNINATAVNASFYNPHQRGASARPARRPLRGKALLQGQAPLEASATFDPLSNFENFEFRFRAKDLQLKRMNDFASAYGKFDFKAGTSGVVIEARAEKGS